MATYNYRCSKQGCRARITLKKRLEEYVIRPKCPSCKEDSLKDRTKTERARTKRRNCFCDGLPWSITNGPHHIGSKGCIHYKGEYDEEYYQTHR